MAKKAPRTKNKDNARRSKKKTSVLVQESVEYIDYKDINLLRRFMSDRAKIRARRVTGNDSQQQKEIARAIKNAREMALLPYANRVTTQRGGGRGRDRDGDGGRDRPPRREENDETSVLELPDAVIRDDVREDVSDAASGGDAEVEEVAE